MVQNTIQVEFDFTSKANKATETAPLSGINIEIANVLASTSSLLNEESLELDGFSEIGYDEISLKWFFTDFDYM